MIDKVKNELDFRGIEVETQLDEIGEVEIIPNELTYAFKQILQNSIQVLREKKEMNPEFRPKIRISLKEVEKGCRVSIFDNGTGIADELKEKVFDPFFTTKMPNKHRGLGLSVASSIIKLHLGDIKLNSIQDESLEIMIDLPSKNFDSEGTQFI